MAEQFNADAMPPAVAAGRRWSRVEGLPFPLGATWAEDGQAMNFSIYSKHAESVRLLLYAADDLVHPVLEFEFDYLKNKSGPIWHCRIARDAVAGASYYAYRIAGPPPAGGFEFHCFDGEKLLLDPYVHTVHFPEPFSRQAACQPGSNAGRAPLGVLPEEVRCFDWGGDLAPRHDSDLVIYELHVKGFTQHPSSALTDELRGTYRGVVEKIPHLVDLGISAVELMPVFQFDPQEGNYWGYMPLGFFSPHHAYATSPGACSQRHEFREMVKAFHTAGIEVILDVVYNHTCEGNRLGPTYSLKGIDNSTYYVASGDPSHPYANFSGTGNTLHTANRAVRRLIVDSMRYWVEQMHVDGFRFDLASIFTRTSEGSINWEDPPIFGQIGAEDELANVRLVAEPWDAAGVYQLGRSFPGMQWMQWNACYRDAIQRFVRGNAGLVPELMTRLYGSSDLFPDDRLYAYRPCQSVNYVASHDGFTMYDLVAYEKKNNWANGHANQDGHDDLSANNGWEGDVGVPPDVLRRRKQQIKNFFALLLLSNGTPMFHMGDEFMQTQGGNSNPFNQDNETSWLNWDRARENADVLRFVRGMIALRKAHPSISRSRFWRDDVSWYGTERLVDMSGRSQCLAYCLHGASEGDDDLYVMINAGSTSQEFGIHEGEPGQWRRAVDTSRPTPDDLVPPSPESTVNAPRYNVPARSLVVLVRAPT